MPRLEQVQEVQSKPTCAPLEQHKALLDLELCSRGHGFEEILAAQSVEQHKAVLRERGGGALADKQRALHRGTFLCRRERGRKRGRERGACVCLCVCE